MAAPAFDLDLLRRFAANHPGLVVDNPICPVDILVALAEHHDPYMRERAVLQDSLPTETLLRSIGDPDPRTAAAIRLAVSKRGYDTVRQALPLMSARDRQRVINTLPPESVQRLATEADERIRYAVARVIDDPVILRDLAADSHGRVRRAASDRVFTSLAS